MVTVVMLNWARPANVLKNIARYSSYAIVDQILCFNNGPPLDCVALSSSKCVLIEASRDLGLYTRFAIAALAGTDAIFHTDDDIAVPEPTVEKLYDRWTEAPLNCHGLHGRAVHDGYDGTAAFGRVEVVLTRALMCSIRTNNIALSFKSDFDDFACVPAGNGEDIVLSFAAMHVSRRLNYAYKLEAEEYPDPPSQCQAIAIHSRWPGHFDHRREIVRRCREIFSLQRPLQGS
jgi:hypothetical protein